MSDSRVSSRRLAVVAAQGPGREHVRLLDGEPPQRRGWLPQGQPEAAAGWDPEPRDPGPRDPGPRDPGPPSGPGARGTDRDGGSWYEEPDLDGWLESPLRVGEPEFVQEPDRDGGASGGPHQGAAARRARLREGLADRVPVPARAVAAVVGRRVPVRAVVVALLAVLAVCAGIVVRTALPGQGSGSVEVVDRHGLVGDRRAFSSAAAGGPATRSALGGPAGAAASRPLGSVPLGSVPLGSVPGGSVPAGSGAMVVVDVVGRVRRGGLVTVPAGSRVGDAVTAAGGPARGAALDRVNLARVLTDGEQVVIPGPDDPIPAAGAGSSGGGAGAGSGAGSGAGQQGAPVNLNQASQADLDGLPGVGPVLAGRILAWRVAHNGFTRVEELGEVGGIGPKLLERLRPLVRV